MTAPLHAGTIPPAVTDDALRQARIELARLGGIARAAKLTREQKSKIGKKAVTAREKKRRLSRKLLKTKA